MNSIQLFIQSGYSLVLLTVIELNSTCVKFAQENPYPVEMVHKKSFTTTFTFGIACYLNWWLFVCGAMISSSWWKTSARITSNFLDKLDWKFFSSETQSEKLWVLRMFIIAFWVNKKFSFFLLLLAEWKLKLSDCCCPAGKTIGSQSKSCRHG